jgi:hypothetical protein
MEIVQPRKVMVGTSIAAGLESARAKLRIPSYFRLKAPKSRMRAIRLPCL